MLIGRRNELVRLEVIYGQNGVKTCSILGRRGVGKSAILLEFCKDKDALYIQFVDQSRFENITLMRLSISNRFETDVPEYDTLVEYFELIGNYCKKKRMVIILDELPYLLKAAPESASIIQRFIDLTIRGTNTMVVICGSVSSVMRNETENPSRPLYGRFNDRLFIKPLSLTECSKFHTNMKWEDIISTYLTVGGIPRYHLRMDMNNYRDNVIKRFVFESADMDQEGPSFVRTEIENAKNHLSILACIASGSVKNNEIAGKLHMDRSLCSKLLKELEDVGIVSKYNPMFGAPKSPVYYIEDNLVAFHYKVVNKLPALIGSPKMDYDLIKHYIDSFLGSRFELLCRDYIISNYRVKEIGRWWGRVDSEDTDIDITAKVIDDNGTVHNMFCECRYSVHPVGFGTLNSLTKKADHLKDAENKIFVLFSLNGFSDELEEYAADNDIRLVSGKDMLGMRSQ